MKELGNPDWNRYFRSTAAHNTLIIDGREQSDISEHHDVGAQARARLNSYHSNSSEVAICAEVEPYWSSGETIHQREISLDALGEITIRDHVRGTGSHRLQWLLHFAPDLEVELRDPATVVARHDSGALTCELRSPRSAPPLRLVRGERSPLQGWVAQSSARVAAAWVLIAEASVALPYELSFHIRIDGRKSELRERSHASGQLESTFHLAGTHT